MPALRLICGETVQLAHLVQHAADTSSSRAADRDRLPSLMVAQRQKRLAWWMGLAVACDEGSSVVAAETDHASITHCIVFLHRR